MGGGRNEKMRLVSGIRNGPVLLEQDGWLGSGAAGDKGPGFLSLGGLSGERQGQVSRSRG